MYTSNFKMGNITNIKDSENVCSSFHSLQTAPETTSPLTGSVELPQHGPPVETVTLNVQIYILIIYLYTYGLHNSSVHVASSSRHHFEIGLTNVDVLVFTSAVRTRSSAPRNTLVTLASCQCPLGCVVSTNRTRSSTLRFRFFNSHFFPSCNTGRYSRIHRAQKWLARTCPLRYCLRE